MLWPMSHRLLLALALVACTPAPEPIPLAAPSRASGKVTTLDAPGKDDPAENTGWWPNVVFDSHDVPRVAFCDVFHGDARYAVPAADGSGWRVDSVVSKGAVGKYIALAVDSHDHAGIAYYDQDHTTLHYAWADKADH